MKRGWCKSPDDFPTWVNHKFLPQLAVITQSDHQATNENRWPTCMCIHVLRGLINQLNNILTQTGLKLGALTTVQNPDYKLSHCISHTVFQKKFQTNLSNSVTDLRVKLVLCVNWVVWLIGVEKEQVIKCFLTTFQKVNNREKLWGIEGHLPKQNKDNITN